MSRKVLVVEDDVEVQSAIAGVLEIAGYDPVCADNGLEALDLLRREEPPGVILLDFQMPEMDGEGFLAARTQLPGREGIPVIVLSAHPESQWKARTLHLPCLMKPFDVDVLLDTVEKYSRRE